MIFVISKKFLTEHPKRYLKVKDYTIIDGASDEDSSGRDSLSNNFNRVVPIGDYYPGNRLVRALLEQQKGKRSDAISPRKLKEMRDDFLDDSDFIQAILATAKIQLCEDDRDGAHIPLDKNVFVVLPQKLYKTLGKDIYKRMRDLFKKVDKNFIYFQDELEKDSDLLEKELKSKLAKDIAKQIKKIEKERKFA